MFPVLVRRAASVGDQREFGASPFEFGGPVRRPSKRTGGHPPKVSACGPASEMNVLPPIESSRVPFPVHGGKVPRQEPEETGHDVAVHEYLGTLVYETSGGPKVVHYWRMEAGHTPTRKLMRDVKAVDWLPLGEAVERLSRGHERAFLQQVGPIALAAANGAEGAALPKVAEPVVPEHKADRVGFLQNLLRLFR